MRNVKKRCIHCHQLFLCKRNPNQGHCAALVCQNARKQKWRKQKLAVDLDYRQNQRRVNETWRRNNTDYWRRYRATHPTYTDKNRQQQRSRDQKRTQNASVSNTSRLAKSDVLSTETIVKSVTYRLVPVAPVNLAKGDALMVEIAVISKGSVEFAKQMPILQRDHLIGAT